MRIKALILVLVSVAASAATPPSVVAIPSGALAPFWITTKDKSGQVEPLKIKAFEAMVLPVTNKQFLEFLKSHPEWRRSKVKTLFADDGYLKQFQSDLKLRGDVTKDSPVTNVSWFAAQAYCEGLGMRLPTMAEWEYLAAASETKTDASQDPAFLRQILEWYSQPQESTTLSKVGRRPKNLYGLHDLHGLIWEWVYDFNSSLVAGEGRTESSLNRELFCGSGAMAGGNKENYAAFMRFAFRSSLKGASTTWNLGFRCVKGES